MRRKYQGGSAGHEESKRDTKARKTLLDKLKNKPKPSSISEVPVPLPSLKRTRSIDSSEITIEAKKLRTSFMNLGQTAVSKVQLKPKIRKMHRSVDSILFSQTRL
jgi:hypothetical protein